MWAYLFIASRLGLGPQGVEAELPVVIAAALGRGHLSGLRDAGS